jgi:hypothetical protein
MNAWKEKKKELPKKHYLFRMPFKFREDLNNYRIPPNLLRAFEFTEKPLSKLAEVKLTMRDRIWEIIDGEYEYHLEKGRLEEWIYLYEPTLRFPLGPGSNSKKSKGNGKKGK